MDQYSLNVIVQIGVALGMGIAISLVFMTAPLIVARYVFEAVYWIIIGLAKVDFRRANKKQKNVRPHPMIIRDWNDIPENRRFRMNEWVRGYEAAMHGERLENYLAAEDSGSQLSRIQRTAFADGFRYYNLEGGDDLKGQPIIELHQHEQPHQRLMTG